MSGGLTPASVRELTHHGHQVLVPSALCEVIGPHYPKAGNGRPPIGLADLACQEALYDSASLRRFVGIDLGRGASRSRVERCMSKLGSYGVDVDARIEEMRGRGVSNA